MNKPLTNVLLKIFANGFYKVHGGILFFLFLVLFGLVEPAQLLNYHMALMLAFITSPLMMSIVFGVWLLYTFKCWHYIAGQILGPHQQFLFYSSTSYTRQKQFSSWFVVQVAVSLPVLVYGSLSIVVAVYHYYVLSAMCILAYLIGIIALSAWFYKYLVNHLIDGSKQSAVMRFTKKWKKPYFSLYLYHVFNKLKVTYLITKLLSYAIINGVFIMFADVSHDTRVAAIAVLAITVAHAIVIFEERRFEETYLIFSKTLPYSKLKLFLSFLGVYALLLIPEAAWLFTRFSPVTAVYLLAFGLGVILFFHCLLYPFGLDMEKYMGWIMGTFVIAFWIIMCGYLLALIPLFLILAYIIKPPNPLESD
ncbi:hypothetical protein KXQ82_19495 [Mucilaginibacter sp. HMF5004]|uniref:hypothetical protein n=1 Tax=Mucilaginibacter rivuli TaxID=2857527 RepID=UPI001C5D002E|nr:hypothetical protein [Mucilaginibacter rivuli]MBW4891918.1 hypothetical protein [Mucilaginibacter rivuli]